MTLEKEAITGTELSSLVRNAVETAVSKQFGEESGKVINFPGAGAEKAQDYPVPANDALKAIHSWTLDPDAIPPSDGQVIHLKQDSSVELISNAEMELRLQEAEMNQPSAAGLVSTLDGAASAIPIVGAIPWGSIIFGAVPGALVSEVVDGLMAPRNADGSVNFMNLGVKAVIAGVGVTFGKRLVGTKAAGFFAAGIGIFILADLLPVDQWVEQLTGLLKPSAASNQDPAPVAQHEQTRSPASTFNPSAGDDALNALRGTRLNRAA